MIPLDTNILIPIINAKPAAVPRRFKGYRMGENGLCSVVAAELASGVAKIGAKPAHHHRSIPTVPFHGPRTPGGE